jgi:oxidoreductase AflY
LEFDQPCLVAESLAAACIHDDWPRLFLFPVEKYLQSHPETPSESLLTVIDDLRSDPIVSNAVKPADPLNKISDGLLKRASKELIPHLAKFQVNPTPEDLAKRTAETTHISAYICGAAQHPRKQEALDFVMLHMTTLSIFYPTFMKQDWISNENKKRMLQWKGWSDAVMYAGCGCPRLYPERITKYAPKRPQDGWQEIIHRANEYQDDGHTSKLIRALLSAGDVSEPYLGMPGFPLQKEDFFKIAHITMDSVERMLEPGYYKMTERVRKMFAVGRGQDSEVVRVIVRWVRWCGVDGAWDDIPDLVQKDGECAPLVTV